MPSLGSIINKGQGNFKKVPNWMGTTYNTVTKVGAFVGVGIDAVRLYKSAKKEVERFVNNIKNIDKNPRIGLYFINAVIRPNPVPLPKYKPPGQTKSLVNTIRTAIKGDTTEYEDSGHFHAKLINDYTDDPMMLWYMQENKHGAVKGDLVNNRRYLDPSDSESKIYRIPKSENRAAESSVFEPEFDFQSTYGYLGDDIDKDYSSITEIFADEKYEFFHGWKNLQGFSVDTNHIWEIRIDRYEGDENKGKVLTPKMPVVKLAYDKLFDYSKWSPVLSYSLQTGSLKTMTIDLFNESQIQFPTGFTYENILNIKILEDRDKTFTKYMNSYINSIYDPKTHSVAHYKNAAFQIDIYVMRPDLKILMKFQFIAVPVKYMPIIEGSEEASVNILDIDFCIVGALSKYDNKKSVKSNQRSSIKLTDVTLISDKSL